MNSDKNRLPLIPYKELGKYCGDVEPHFYSIEHYHYVAIPTDHSFKVSMNVNRIDFDCS
jgi:hypothetical protein